VERSRSASSLKPRCVCNSCIVTRASEKIISKTYTTHLGIQSIYHYVIDVYVSSPLHNHLSPHCRLPASGQKEDTESHWNTALQNSPAAQSRPQSRTQAICRREKCFAERGLQTEVFSCSPKLPRQYSSTDNTQAASHVRQEGKTRGKREKHTAIFTLRNRKTFWTYGPTAARMKGRGHSTRVFTAPRPSTIIVDSVSAGT
jgi:hypothetical protein